MSLPSVLMLGFGEAGPLAQQNLAAAAAQGMDVQYLALPGNFDDLTTPQPGVWNMLKKAVEGRDEAIIIWGGESLVLWDRLARALGVNHQPDFLWPLPLALNPAGGVQAIVPHLFTAVGAFELSLYPLGDLYAFHHAARARAIAKLLLVRNPDTLTIVDYLNQGWGNFESVKAPDNWLIHAADCSLVFDNAPRTQKELAAHQLHFEREYNKWQMGREGLAARTRNTLAASEFVRANLAQLETMTGDLIKRHPYYGHWPVKAGRVGNLILPCSGYHPVVASHIWRGFYHDHARDLWNTMFAQGGAKNILDIHGDGGFFGLLLARQQPSARVTVAAHDMQDAARTQAAIEVNCLANAVVHFGALPSPSKDMLAVVRAGDAETLQALLGKADIFMPLDGEALPQINVPQHYVAFTLDRDRSNLTPLDPKTTQAAALVILHRDHARQAGAQ